MSFLTSSKKKFSFLSFFSKLDWYLSFLLISIGMTAVAMLVSAGKGSWEPWAINHFIRFIIGFLMMFIMGCCPARWFYRFSYFFYCLALVLLLIVDFSGSIKKGAERWIDLGFMQLQPSEIAKIALILALSRFYHDAIKARSSLWIHILAPIFFIILPVALVLVQPDLGTSILLMGGGVAIMFFAGIPWWFFTSGLVAVLGMAGIIWENMHTYQKTRVTIFLNPEQDPLGKGYHIMQSKIAMGSGGFWGKGFMGGSQTSLDFLPEKHTDFAFTAFTEQFGLVGGLLLIFLFFLVILRMIKISFKTDYWFGKLLIMGLAVNLFCHLFVNMAMVMGLLPVVGIPLPFFSYGGTSMLSFLFGFGLLMSVRNNSSLEISGFKK